MALPDGSVIPLDVVADRWTKIFGELVTVDRLRSWHNAGMLTIDSRSDFLWRTRGSREDRLKVFPTGFIMHEDWITREERDRFESEYVPETPAATVQGIPGEAAAEIVQITPRGGDRLTEKLYDFANEVGAKSVTTKGFRDWLNEKHKDFDTSHGSISYRQENGEWAEVKSGALQSRIYRLKAVK